MTPSDIDRIAGRLALKAKRCRDFLAAVPDGAVKDRERREQLTRAAQDYEDAERIVREYRDQRERAVAAIAAAKKAAGR